MRIVKNQPDYPNPSEDQKQSYVFVENPGDVEDEPDQGGKKRKRIRAREFGKSDPTGVQKHLKYKEWLIVPIPGASGLSSAVKERFEWFYAGYVHNHDDHGQGNGGYTHKVYYQWTIDSLIIFLSTGKKVDGNDE